MSTSKPSARTAQVSRKPAARPARKAAPVQAPAPATMADVLAQLAQVRAMASSAFWGNVSGPEAGELTTLATAICGFLQLVDEAHAPGMVLGVRGADGGAGITFSARPANPPAPAPVQAPGKPVLRLVHGGKA